MNWQALESKMLIAAAYDAEQRILYLRFRSIGDVYRYFDFPTSEYQAFLDAEYHGRFFLARIRDHYNYERLARRTAA
jgi:hypothetical protein